MDTLKQKDDQRIINLLYQLGNTYLEKGDFDNAIDKFKKLIQLGEQNAKTFLTLSRAYILKEQFDQESLNVFEISYKFEPENPVLNVILSQIYLNMQKEDSLACQVFKNALQHNPQNSSAILARLVHIHILKEDIESVREFMQQMIDFEESLSRVLPQYVKLEWKNNSFESVSNFFQQLIKHTQNSEYYPWLMVNYLQRASHEPDRINISNAELAFYRTYFSNFDFFQRMFDLYLFIHTENLLARNVTEKSEKKDPNSVEEFELFLAEDSFSNIIERGLNIQKNPSESTIDFYLSDMWCKLTPWFAVNSAEEALSTQSPFEKSDIRQIIKKTRTLILIRVEGRPFSPYQNRLRDALTRDYDSEKDFIFGASLNDGMVIFTHDVKKSVDNLVHFLQGLSSSRNGNSENNAKFQILIHQIAVSHSEEELNLLHELQMLLSVFEFEKQLLMEKSESGAPGKFQLFITTPVEKLLKKISTYSIVSLENRLHHPLTHEPAQLFQVFWNDGLAKIQRGDVKTIGRYKILEELHPNGVFTSFRAMDTYLERLVVLKILRPDFNITSSKVITEELFLKEAKFFGKINHPNIAMIYDIAKEEDFCFFAREFVEGNVLSVQKVLNNKINWQRSLRICLNIIETLEFIHQKNIFHGKLEPNNIFITNGSDVKITDFQIHPFYIPAHSYAKPQIKALTYSAPEKLEDQPTSLHSDIYSMGVIMYELLTDLNPFNAATKDEIIARVHDSVPDIVSSINSDLPKQLDDIVSKMIAKSQPDRYENFSGIKKELKEIIQNMEK